MLSDGAGNVPFRIDSSSNIHVTGTVDGRDIATDGTKLDTIETNADATDTTNVVAALTAGTNVSIASNGTISSTNTTYSVGDGGLTQNNFTTTLKSKLDGIESGATGDQSASEISGLEEFVEDQIGANIIGGTNVSVSYNDGTGQTTLSSTDTNTTYSAGSGLGLSGTTFSHTDTSSQASVNNSGRTYIQDITLDTYGHITAISSATETVVNTDTNTNLTHTGEVTGSTSLTIANNVVDEANLKVSNSPTNGYALTAQSGNTGGLTWAEISSGGDDDLYWSNIRTISSSKTLSSTRNTFTAGDITINSGVTLTIPHGGAWSVL